MFSTFIALITRHALTAIGLYLVNKGVLSPELTEAFVNIGLGAMTFSIGLIWSIIKNLTLLKKG